MKIIISIEMNDKVRELCSFDINEDTIRDLIRMVLQEVSFDMITTSKK